MSSKPQFFFFIMMAMIIVGLVWYFGLFDKTRDFSLNFGGLESVKLEGQKNTFKATAQNIFETIVDIPSKLGASVVKNTKEALLKNAKEELGSAIDSAQQKFGLDGQPVNERPLVMALAGAINQPLSFFINNNNGQESSYVIDWGDGERSNGNVGLSEKKIIRHVWQAIGVYLVTADIATKNKEIKKYSFPIAIE